MCMIDSGLPPEKCACFLKIFIQQRLWSNFSSLQDLTNHRRKKGKQVPKMASMAFNQISPCS